MKELFVVMLILVSCAALRSKYERLLDEGKSSVIFIIAKL